MAITNKLIDFLNRAFYMYAWDYWTLAIVLFVISLGFLVLKHFMKKNKKTYQIITLTVFFIYIAMVVYTAVIHRESDPDSSGLSLIPFYSYKMIANGNSEKIREVIMNIALFIPIGFLYCLIDTKKINYRKWPIIAFSVAFSILIEVAQFVFKLGWVETDDVIHNCLGCCLGMGIYILLDYMTFNERDF